MEKAKLKKVLPVAFVILLMAVACFAASSTSDTTFTDLVSKLKDWAQGGLGKTFALASLLVGLGLGIVRQSVMGAATGFGIAAASYYGPGVLEGVFSAVMGNVHNVTSALHFLM